MEFLQKNIRSIVVALLAVGIITAVSVGGNDDGDNGGDNPESSEQAEGETSDNLIEAPNQGDQDEETNDDASSDETSDTSEETAENTSEEPVSDSEPLAPVERTVETSDGSFSVSALSGDSQTTLSRAIVGDYTEQNGVDLNAEQALFVETNLVESLGRDDNIEIGDTVRLEESQVADLVSQAQNLSDAEQALWAQYL